MQTFILVLVLRVKEAVGCFLDTLFQQAEVFRWSYYSPITLCDAIHLSTAPVCAMLYLSDVAWLHGERLIDQLFVAEFLKRKVDLCCNCY